MSSIYIEENINGITEQLKKFSEQHKMAECELYRMEGMLRVFVNLKELGVTHIPIHPPKVDIKEPSDDEVIDEPSNVPVSEA